MQDENNTVESESKDTGCKSCNLFFVFAGVALLLAGDVSYSQAHAFSSYHPVTDIEQSFSREPNNLEIRAGITTVAGNEGDLALDPQDMGKGAYNFIDAMANEALGLLSNAEMDEEARKAEFKTLLEESFDMNTIGRFSLGTYWRVSTQQQRREYLQLFREMVVDIYTNRFSDYEGQHFETRKHRFDGKRDTIVTSYITSDVGDDVQVDWRVRYKNGSYKIVDVIVEGVSMSMTQRSDFSSVIQRGGGDVQALLTHLKK